MLNAIEKGDCEAFSQFLSAQLMDSISFFDYKEDYYHGFLAGILKCFQKYAVRSNREIGEGRSDLILEDYETGEKGIIIEIRLHRNSTRWKRNVTRHLHR